MAGAVISSAAGSLYVLFSNLREIARRYRVSFTALFHQLLFIVLGLLCMWGMTSLLNAAGLQADAGSKLICLVKLAVSGLLSMGTYLGVTWFFQIPQTVFGLRGRRHV